jgi:hypothetical protein
LYDSASVKAERGDMKQSILSFTTAGTMIEIKYVARRHQKTAAGPTTET